MPDYYATTIRTYTVTRFWLVRGAPDTLHADGAARAAEQNESDLLSDMEVSEVFVDVLEELDESDPRHAHAVEISLVHPSVEVKVS